MRLFKKKKLPVDNPGNYDWTFQYVRGGFCELAKLRKPIKRKYLVIVWLGGIKFRMFKIWNVKQSPFITDENKVEYKQTITFNPDDIDNFIKNNPL